jgi:hypothetical protein
MPKYVVQWKYSSSLGGPYLKNDVVEMDEALVEAINRDSPGVLKPISSKNVKGPVDPDTIRDRMVKQANERGRGKQEPMTRDNFGAVAPKED